MEFGKLGPSCALCGRGEHEGPCANGAAEQGVETLARERRSGLHEIMQRAGNDDDHKGAINAEQDRIIEAAKWGIQKGIKRAAKVLERESGGCCEQEPCSCVTTKRNIASILEMIEGETVKDRTNRDTWDCPCGFRNIAALGICGNAGCAKLRPDPSQSMIEKADQFMTDSFPGGITKELLGAFLETVVSEETVARPVDPLVEGRLKDLVDQYGGGLELLEQYRSRVLEEASKMPVVETRQLLDFILEKTKEHHYKGHVPSHCFMCNLNSKARAVQEKL